jgi:DNA-directed RNA polymerase subunit RPC12/RpoP
MRCPDCNKFVSFDTEEDPDVTTNVDATGEIGVEVRIVNKCSECGTELKEASFESVIEMPDAAEHAESHGKKFTGFEVTNEDCSRSEDRRPKGRPARYTKQFYGYELEVTIQCGDCGEEFKGECSDMIQASGMDELV